MDIQLREKAISLIPELENMLGIDMSIDSFMKNDLPYYFNITSNNNDKCINFTYNFETNFGSGQITVESFGEESEVIIWNDIVQTNIDNKKSVGTK